MRKEFATWMADAGGSDQKTIFLTGDLGFQALENVRDVMGNRFVNVGVSEQNMVSMAAAMAQQGLTPFCYSIAPFAVFRPAEQIRLDVCIHNKNVKIVGNGGGYGYGIMGPTHHAIEDLAVLSSFPNMKCFVPFCNEEVSLVCQAMQEYKGPSYLRLGFGKLPETMSAAKKYEKIKKLASGSECTVIGIGPVILNAISACNALGIKSDIFAISEIPLTKLSSELLESLARTRKLLIVEEHVRRGGLAEHLSLFLFESKLGNLQMRHQFAKGYPNQQYGNQAFHQAQSGLDEMGLKSVLQEMINESTAI